MTALFIVTTSQHAQTALLLAPQLAQGQMRVCALSLDHYYQYGIPLDELSRQGIQVVTPMLPTWVQQSNRLMRYLTGIWQLPAILRKLIQQEQVDIIVLGNDRLTLHRQIIETAHRLAIPVILLQDGIIFDTANQAAALAPFSQRLKSKLLALLAKLEIIYRLPLGAVPYGAGGCDHLLVMGKQAKQLFIERGVANNQIKITGLPRLDELSQIKARAREIRSRFRAQQQISDHIPVVLWITQPFLRWNLITPEEHQTFVANTAKSLTKFLAGGGQLWIKYHPSDKADFYETIINANLATSVDSKQIRSFAKENIHDLIVAADLTFGVHSTALLEALLLDTPTVFLQLLPSAPVPSIYLDARIGRIITQWDEFEELLLQGASDTTSFTALMAYDGINDLMISDGKAGERVADWLATLAKERHLTK